MKLTVCRLSAKSSVRDAVVMSRPPTETVPVVGVSSAPIMLSRVLSRVVLPAPRGARGQGDVRYDELAVRHVQVHSVQRPHLYGADLVMLGDSDQVNQPSTLRSPGSSTCPKARGKRRLMYHTTRGWVLLYRGITFTGDLTGCGRTLPNLLLGSSLFPGKRGNKSEGHPQTPGKGASPLYTPRFSAAC